MLGDSLFTSILDFPTGFDAPFTVAVGDTVIGSFGPGQIVDFTGSQGGGVRSFTLSGISPFADAGDPTAFPLRLELNTPTADFTMAPLSSAVPEPCSIAAWMGLAGIGIAGCIRYRHRRQPR
jgi:hypothetical protein